jgi:hypothetical protein
LFEHDLSQITGPIEAAGLADLVERGPSRFYKSLRYVLGLAHWWETHSRIDGINNYIRPVAELRLPTAILEMLPCSTDDCQPRVLLPASKWVASLKYASERTSDHAGIEALVASGVRVALRDAGVDLQAVQGPEVAELMQLVETAPDYIRGAELLSLAEKTELAAVGPTVPQDVATRAKQLAVEYLQRRRGAGVQDAAQKRGSRAVRIGKSIRDVFDHFVTQIRRDDQSTRETRLFDDPDHLLKAVLVQLAASDTLADASLGDRQAFDVLAEQLQALDWPMFALVATCILRSSCAAAAASRWLDAMQEPTAEPEEPA